MIPVFDNYGDRIDYFEDLILNSKSVKYVCSACPDIEIYDGVLKMFGSGSRYSHIDDQQRTDLINKLDKTTNRMEAFNLVNNLL